MKSDYKVGDYKWEQLSMWEFAPEKAVEKYVPIINSLTGKTHNLHYYLRQCTEVVSESHTRWRTVTKDEELEEIQLDG